MLPSHLFFDSILQIGDDPYLQDVWNPLAKKVTGQSVIDHIVLSNMF